MLLPLIVAGALVAGGVGLLLYQVWRKRQAAKRECELIAKLGLEPLPEGARELLSELGLPDAGFAKGKLSFIVNGTFSANFGRVLFTLLERAGLEALVGSILVLELDRGVRQRFMEEIPSVMLDRVIEVDVPGLDGLGNRTVDQVKEIINYWGPAVHAGARELGDLHRRRTNSTDPALFIVLLGLGGSAILATEALKELTPKFRTTRLAALATYPSDDRLRRQIPRVFDEYRAVGLRRFLVADNLGHNRDRNDAGMLAAIVALAAASARRDGMEALDNFFSLLVPEDGGIASFHVLATGVPAYCHQLHPVLPARYWVRGDATAAAVVAALDEVDRPEYAAVRAELGHPDSARYDIILTGLMSDGCEFIEREVAVSQVMKYGPSPANRHLVVGGARVVVDPAKPSMPLVVVSLRALSELEQVEHLTKLAPALPSAAVRAALHAGSSADGAEDDPSANVDASTVVEGVVLNGKEAR